MDIMNIEIEEDGTISIKTKDISEKNHFSADDFLDEIEELLGSKRKTTPVEHDFWKTRDVRRINGHTKIVRKA